VLSQHSKTILDVLNQGIDRGKAPVLALALLDAGKGSKLAPGGKLGFDGGHTTPNIVPGEHLEMRLNFLIEFPVKAAVKQHSMNP